MISIPFTMRSGPRPNDRNGYAAGSPAVVAAGSFQRAMKVPTL
jgi:hypothetical protein